MLNATIQTTGFLTNNRRTVLFWLNFKNGILLCCCRAVREVWTDFFCFQNFCLLARFLATIDGRFSFLFRFGFSILSSVMSGWPTPKADWPPSKAWHFLAAKVLSTSEKPSNSWLIVTKAWIRFPLMMQSRRVWGITVEDCLSELSIVFLPKRFGYQTHVPKLDGLS